MWCQVEVCVLLIIIVDVPWMVAETGKVSEEFM